MRLCLFLKLPQKPFGVTKHLSIWLICLHEWRSLTLGTSNHETSNSEWLVIWIVSPTVVLSFKKIQLSEETYLLVKKYKAIILSLVATKKAHLGITYWNSRRWIQINSACCLHCCFILELPTHHKLVPELEFWRIINQRNKYETAWWTLV